LLDARRPQLAHAGLDPGGDVHRLEAPIDGTPAVATRAGSRDADEREAMAIMD
jgi:hypothetical protein